MPFTICPCEWFHILVKAIGCARAHLIFNLFNWSPKCSSTSFCSLSLNHSKCEFMLFGSNSQLNKLDIDSISISGNDIPLSSSCRNLGVIFYSQMSMSKQNHQYLQISSLSIACAILALSENTSLVLLQRNLSTRSISSRLDFSNGLLYNLPNARLQKLQNAAPRIVSLSSKRSYITPILKTLHWLPVKERIRLLYCQWNSP